MSDIVERLRKLAEDLIGLDLDMRLPHGSINPHSAADEIERMRAENSTLRSVVSQSAAALGNGAYISPVCSVEFMAQLPSEIGLVVGSLRRELSEARNNALERAEKAAQGHYKNRSDYDENSPFYGSDLTPDRSDFGRGMQAGREAAAAAIRKLKETGE